jgi:hypothetical protein
MRFCALTDGSSGARMRCARLVSGVFRNTPMPLLWQAGGAPQGAFLASRTLMSVGAASPTLLGAKYDIVLNLGHAWCGAGRLPCLFSLYPGARTAAENHFAPASFHFDSPRKGHEPNSPPDPRRRLCAPALEL